MRGTRLEYALYISISRPQPAGTTASTRSAPMTGRSERRPSDPMLILFRVHTCHMPREVQPSLSDKAGNWRTASSLSDSKVGDVFAIDYCTIDPLIDANMQLSK